MIFWWFIWVFLSRKIIFGAKIRNFRTLELIVLQPEISKFLLTDLMKIIQIEENDMIFDDVYLHWWRHFQSVIIL